VSPQKSDEYVLAELFPEGPAGKHRPCLKAIPTEWTTVERIQVATVLLKCFEDKLPLFPVQQFMSQHPILAMALRVLNDDPETLNAMHDKLAAL